MVNPSLSNQVMGSAGETSSKPSDQIKAFTCAMANPLGKALRRTNGKAELYYQTGVKQAAALNEIYPDSANTFRIITENFSGQPRIVAALLRIGQSGSYVDNFTQGGIALGIDLESGQALEQGSLEVQKDQPSSRHKFPFSDFTVPNWPAFKSFVLECCQKLSLFPHLGWDIAPDRGRPTHN